MTERQFPSPQVHADEIKRNKEMLEEQKIKERNALNDKLKTAASLRDENIKRILERLREHVSRPALSPFERPSSLKFTHSLLPFVSSNHFTNHSQTRSSIATRRTRSKYLRSATQLTRRKHAKNKRASLRTNSSSPNEIE